MIEHFFTAPFIKEWGVGNGEWGVGSIASLSFRVQQSGVEKSHSGMIRAALGQEISGPRVSIEPREALIHSQNRISYVFLSNASL